jgi:hypothetical protein
MEFFISIIIIIIIILYIYIYIKRERERSQIQWLIPIVSATWEAEIGGLQSKANLDKKPKTLPEKWREVKRLSGKCEVLSSNPGTAKE